MANLAAALGNTKTRTMLLIMGSIFILGLIIALSNLKGATIEESKKSRGPSVPDSIKPTPGGATSKRYQELQEKDNKQRAEAARKKNDSSIATIIGGQNTDSSSVDDQLLGAFTSKPKESSDSELDKLLELQRQQAAEDERFRRQQDEERRAERLARLAEEQQRNIDSIVAAMDGQAKAALKAWATFTPQTYIEGSPSEDTSAGVGAGATDGTSTEETTPPLIKAGEVIFAVLDTGVNTDEPSPVLARVVHGKFKGAKLIGSVSKSDNQFAEKVILNFNSMNSPQYEKSISVSMVAIDPDTARTAIASDVDHHYLLRYGSLFASSFMEGFGQAISEQGTVSQQSGSGDSSSTTTTKPKLTGKEQFFSALGNVGSKWAEVVGENYDRPITISVDAGTGIGLLVLQDITV